MSTGSAGSGNPAAFEAFEAEVEERPECHEFTRWAKGEASQDSVFVHSGQDFPEGYNTDTSASQPQSTTNAAAPLAEQMRARILEDDEHVVMRKRHEMYFHQMQSEVEAQRRALRVEFMRREKALAERESRLCGDESEKLNRLKTKMKADADANIQKCAEMLSLKQKMAALEGEIGVLKKNANRRRAEETRLKSQLETTIADLKSERARLQRVEEEREAERKNYKQNLARIRNSQRRPSNKREESVQWELEAETQSQRDESVTSSLSARRIEVGDAVRRSSEQDFNDRNVTRLHSPRISNLSATSCKSTSSSLSTSSNQRPRNSVLLHNFEEESPCGCRTLLTKPGITNRWFGNFNVTWTEGGSRVEVYSPESVKLRFAADGRLDIILPNLSGLRIDKHNSSSTGDYWTERGGEIFEELDIEELRCNLCSDGTSLEWEQKDVLLRRFSNADTKLEVQGVRICFIHRPGKGFYITHTNERTEERTRCFDYAFP